MKWLFLILGFWFIPPSLSAETISLQPAPGMSRAELHYEKLVKNPKAVLVLCPGINGSAARRIQSEAWRKWAVENQVDLVGLSFASPLEAITDGSGYYYASQGSGAKLLEGIQQIYGRTPPLLLYGFSGGAHFVSRFTEWKPERVLSWCAYSADWWDVPKVSRFLPPGIVACGQWDSRLGASLLYFKQGRAIGKPWLWIEVKKAAHQESSQLDDFVRAYFSAMLEHNRQSSPAWVDIDTKEITSEPLAQSQPTLTARFPHVSLYPQWKRVHSP